MHGPVAGGGARLPEFKNGQKARNLSILLPGGGFFYTGHPIIGMGDAIVETVLIVLVGTGLVNMLTESVQSEVAVAQAVIFGSILFLEKRYSVYHAKHHVKEYLPVDTNIQPLRR